MANVPYSFDEDGARRIVRAVKHVESSPRYWKQLNPSAAYGERPQILFGVLVSDLVENGNSTMTVWAGNPLAATSYVVAVKGFLVKSTITATTRVAASWDGNSWQVTQAKCAT